MGRQTARQAAAKISEIEVNTNRFTQTKKQRGKNERRVFTPHPTLHLTAN
jgi:hypothetical protein